jgi:hypothetical protein
MATTLPVGSQAHQLAQTGALARNRVLAAVCCAPVFAIVVVGGVTRLTHSGLSITNGSRSSARCRPCRKPTGRRVCAVPGHPNTTGNKGWRSTNSAHLLVEPSIACWAA